MSLSDAEAFLAWVGSHDVRVLRFYYMFGRYNETPEDQIPLILELKHANARNVLEIGQDHGFQFTIDELNEVFDQIQEDGLKGRASVQCVGCVQTAGHGTCVFKDRPKGGREAEVPACIFPTKERE